MATCFRRSRRSYYVRLLVPAALRAMLQKREVWKSLHTVSYQEAKLRAALWEGRLARLFIYLKLHSQPWASGTCGRMKPEQIKQLVSRYITERLDEWEQAWYGSRVVDGRDEHPFCDTMPVMCDEEGEPSEAQWQEHLALFTESMRKDCAQALKHNSFSSIEPRAQEFITRYRLPVEKGTPLHRSVCRELLKAEQVIAKTIGERVQGHFDGAYPLQTVAPQLPEAVSLVPSKPFTEVMTLYFHENKRQPRTDAQIKSGYEKFVQIVGGDRPIGEIAKAHCRLYKEALGRLPRAMKAKDKERSVVELLKSLPLAGKYQAIGVSSVNKYLHNLSHLFDWAKGQGFYEGENPVEGLSINKRQAGGKQKRKPFTDEDLARIFGHQDYRQQLVKHPERYWVVLILLYTGARREEVAQLALGDIKQQDGGWYFHITPEGELNKSAKNEASKRRVPVHSHLISLGLLAFVEQTRKAKHDRLFPMLEKGRNGYGDAIGKFFARYLHKIGITDPAKVIHSFRHTVVTRLAAAGVPQDMREVLVGHAADTVHGQTYVHREAIPLSLLQTHLERLDFRGCLNGLRDVETTK